MQELFNMKELQLIAEIEENRLTCEGEVDRVLSQHNQAIVSCYLFHLCRHYVPVIR